MVEFTHKDKRLQEMSYEELLDAEKFLLKKVLQADRAGMSINMINQLNNIVDSVRIMKNQVNAKPLESGVLNIGEIESERTDDTDRE